MATEKGFIDSFKESFDRPASWYLELAGFLIAGFILGFLLKHAGKTFFLLILGAALALWALDFFHIITIHVTVAKTLLGLSAETTMQEVMQLSVSWLTSHVIESLAALFGFILAWKFA